MNKLQMKLAEQASINPVVHSIAPQIETSVHTFDLNFHIDAAEILQYILEYKEKYPKSNKSNVHAWHSDWVLHKHMKQFDKLIEIVENRVHSCLPYNKHRTAEVFESWAIIYKKGDKTSRHKHCSQIYSAVYYVKAEDNVAPLQFDDHLSIIPKTGMLVCFPGYLYHSVPKLTSDQDRVCISFNLNCNMNVNLNIDDEYYESFKAQ